MSERQQLALIKKLEKAAKQNEGASSTTSDQGSASAAISASTASADSILASPPRAPLQVMTDANNAATSCITSGSSSAAESPATPNATSYDRNHGKTNQNNSPAVDRLIKKISKKNTKGETPLHTAAIRGSSRLVIIFIDNLFEKISNILTDFFFGFRSNNCSRWVPPC